MAAFAGFAVIGIGAPGSLAGGLLADRYGQVRIATLSLAISGSCAVLTGMLVGASPWLILLVGLVWGFWVIADSAQFSALVAECSDPRYTGTALTLQLATGFALTVVSIFLVPEITLRYGWEWSLAMLALGPVVGIWAMLRIGR